MTNQDIDRRLALAIGWTKNQMQLDTNGNVFLLRDGLGGKYWRFFDHTNPAVIWPIAERFDAFPLAAPPDGKWRVFPMCDFNSAALHKVAATASALAVIKYVESKK